MKSVRIAVAGAGLIGLRHIEEIRKGSSAVLASIVDVSPKAAEVAKRYDVKLYASLADLFTDALGDLPRWPPEPACDRRHRRSGPNRPCRDHHMTEIRVATRCVAARRALAKGLFTSAWGVA